MLEYFYTEDTKEYTHSAEVFVDPLESQNQRKNSLHVFCKCNYTIAFRI